VVDRSVDLRSLRERAEAAPARSKSTCKNPECSSGLTPGLMAAGGGSKGAPLYGAGGVGAKRLMRWTWVRCLACNAPDDARKAGATYRHLNLSEGEIARRAQLANTKSSYQPESKDVARTTLSRPGQPAASSADNAKLTELLEQNKQLNERLGEVLKQNVAMTDTLSRMTMQIAALLEDNAKLRAAQTSAPTPPSAA
jgi:hypothetical protein